MTDKEAGWFATRGLLKSNYRKDVDLELVEKVAQTIWALRSSEDVSWNQVAEYVKDSYRAIANQAIPIILEEIKRELEKFCYQQEDEADGQRFLLFCMKIRTSLWLKFWKDRGIGE